MPSTKESTRVAYLRCIQAHPCSFITKCAREREAYIRARAHWTWNTQGNFHEWLDLCSIIL